MMAQRTSRSEDMRKFLLVAPLFVLLAVSVWWAVSLWVSVEGPPMPTSGYVAMTFGILFSLIVGCGLMALLFYSHRHGYDEPSRLDEHGDR
jgi:hypothetical protein